MPLKVMIVEDDPLILEDISYSVEELGIEVAGKAYNMPAAIDILKKNKIELALLDIDLDDEQNGIDLAEHINKNYRIPFIYITSFYDDNTLQRAKATQPAGYVVKPFNEKDIKVAIELAINKTRPRPAGDSKKIFIKDKGELLPINIQDIEYVQSDDNYCKIFIKNKNYMVLKTLKEMSAQLEDKGFLQVHRSYLVNFTKITKISEDYVFIDSAKIPVSKSYKKSLMDRLEVL